MPPVCKVTSRRTPQDEPLVTDLSASLSLPVAVAASIFFRGGKTKELARRFINASTQDLSDPSEIEGADAFAKDLLATLSQKESIAIYSDYDVDGVSSAAILGRLLLALGTRPIFHIPDRMLEGYGLNQRALDKLRGLGVKLLIALDCGTNSGEIIHAVEKLGMKIIVIDHHLPLNDRSLAPRLINPNVVAFPEPARSCCTTGIVFHLVTHICRNYLPKHILPPSFLTDMLDLVAVGTICDIAELKGDNRIFAKRGLRRINMSPSVPISAIKEVSGSRDVAFDERDVGYIIGPRLNASGRVASAKLALNLLLSTDMDSAIKQAAELERLNAERRRYQDECFAAALAQMREQGLTDSDLPITLWSERWHEGILGIVAAKLAKAFERPAILLAKRGEVLKGSARSIEGVNIFDMLRTAEDALLAYGGHEMAAGIKLEASRFDEFKESICQAYKIMSPTRQKRTIVCDWEIALGELGEELTRSVSAIAPFGRGNEIPSYVVENVLLSRNPDGSIRLKDLGGKTQLVLRPCPDKVFGEIGPAERLGVAAVTFEKERNGSRPCLGMRVLAVDVGPHS